jgi:hypothetical protein
VTTTAANTPQMGGTLTVLNQYYTQDPAGFDPQLNQSDFRYATAIWRKISLINPQWFMKLSL